jgi:hypothetical protein
MRPATIAILLAILALGISLFGLFRNPYERRQAEACENTRTQCNTQCDLVRDQALLRLRLDSTDAVMTRNNDLLECRITHLGNQSAIDQCQAEVNAAFSNVQQTLTARRNEILANAEACRLPCTEAYNECIADIEPIPGPAVAASDCETASNACTISVPGPCEHTEVNVKISCEELECMGITCRGDIPGLPVCLDPGPIEDGFSMEFRMVDKQGKELDRFPALRTEPDCRFSVMNDEKTVMRIRKHENADVQLVIRTKAKAPYEISLEGRALEAEKK